MSWQKYCSLVLPTTVTMTWSETWGKYLNGREGNGEHEGLPDECELECVVLVLAPEQAGHLGLELGVGGVLLVLEEGEVVGVGLYLGGVQVLEADLVAREQDHLVALDVHNNNNILMDVLKDSEVNAINKCFKRCVLTFTKPYFINSEEDCLKQCAKTFRDKQRYLFELSTIKS